MTTYNTGNPIGSTDARDRLDNTENMDYLENSTTELTHPDRLGTVRKTRHGMEVEHDAQIAAHESEHDAQMQSFENDFDGRLAGMAFIRVGSFTEGATLTDMRQVLVWEVSQGGDGHEYGWTGSFSPSGKVVIAGSTPATSGGIGAGAWVDRTDVTLRSDLASESGSGLVGYQPTGTGAVSTTVHSKLRETVSVQDFGAVGDGVTDDTAAIQAALATGQTIYFPEPAVSYRLDSNLSVTTQIVAGRYRLFSGAGVVTFPYQNEVFPEWFGAVADGLSISPTDSYAGLQAAITSVTVAGSVGGQVVLNGAYYCTQTLVIDYRPSPTQFQGGAGVGLFVLRGQTGMYTDKLLFPSTCKSGINNNPTNTVTSVQMHDFAVIRSGYSLSDYSAQTGQRVPNTFDPNFGYGIRDSTNGYSGFVKNVNIQGFYVQIVVFQSYAGQYDNLFAVNQSVYGIWLQSCSTVRLTNSYFSGTQAGFCADTGSFTTENVTVEGSLISFNNNPALLTSWDGIGFQVSNCTWTSTGDYCERLGGPAIDARNSSVYVRSGAMSNNQWFEVLDSGTLLSAACKSALLAKDANLTNIKWVCTAGQVRSATFRGGFVRQETIYLDSGSGDTFVANNTEVGVPAVSLEQAAPMFTNQRAAWIVLSNVVDQWTITNQIPATRVAGALEVRLPYSTNYTGFAGLAVGRNKVASWGNARNKFEYIPTTTDLLYMYRSVYDNANVETKTTVWAPYALDGHEFRRPIYPNTGGTISNGLATNKWSVIYAATGSINTSDSREKQQVRELSEAERAVAVRIKGLIRAFKFNDAVEQKGESARIHVGVIAQDVKAAFEAEGLVAEQYAALCYDEWDERQEVVDENTGEVLDAYRPAGNQYGVRYEELLAFIIGAL